MLLAAVIHGAGQSNQCVIHNAKCVIEIISRKDEKVGELMKAKDIPDWKIAKWETDMDIIAERANSETEYAHIDADNLLCQILREIGFERIAELFQHMKKWYS